MRHLSRLAIATFIFTGMLGTPVAANANEASSALANARGSRIVGVWSVTVDVYNCDTRAHLKTFPALHKFDLGGTGGIAQAGTSPAVPTLMMVWKHLGADRYSADTKFFRYDAGGLVGMTVLNNEVWLSEDGMAYGGFGVSRLFDLSGNELGIQGCVELSGTRFTGDG